MKVKIFDENHEKDLEDKINEFLKEQNNIIDIKYQVSIAMFSEEQIYCFSALILYYFIALFLSYHFFVICHAMPTIRLK